jgi:hypothetical protein
MKKLVYVLVLAFVPVLAQAEEAWRWTDGDGVVHYTNRQDVAPGGAERVTTRLIVNATRLPNAETDLVMSDGEVFDTDAVAVAAPEAKRPRQIYTEERRRFGCFAAETLYAGGWAHPDDISVDGGCLPYLLGVEGWLNSARAELALREYGIDWKQVVPMYVARKKWDAAIEKRILGDD